jgi:hypothetical protein
LILEWKSHRLRRLQRCQKDRDFLAIDTERPQVSTHKNSKEACSRDYFENIVIEGQINAKNRDIKA